MGTLICKGCGCKEFYRVPGFYICKSCGKKYSELEASQMERVVVKKPPVAKKPDLRLSVKNPNKGTIELKPVGVIKHKAPERKEVGIKKLVRANNITLPKMPKGKAIGNEISIKDSINDNNVVESLLVFAYDSYRAKDYLRAEEYANHIIELEPKNVDAWLIKGNCASEKTSNIIFRLEDSIKYWYNAIMYARDTEVEDLKYSINTRLMSTASGFTVGEVNGFIISPGPSYIETLDKTILYLSPIIKRAQSLLGLNEELYYEILTDKLINIANKAYTRALDKFNVEDIRRTDALYLELKDSTDACIEMLEYTLRLCMGAKEMKLNLDSLIKCHRGIIHLCSYKLSGHRLKPSLECSREEREERLNKISEYEAYIKNSILIDEDLSKESKNPLVEIGALNKEIKALDMDRNNIPELIRLKELNDRAPSASLIPLKRVVLKKTMELDMKINSTYKKILLISITYNLNKTI